MRREICCPNLAVRFEQWAWWEGRAEGLKWPYRLARSLAGSGPDWEQTVRAGPKKPRSGVLGFSCGSRDSD